MDLHKLRPTQSQWHQPLVTVTDARSRIRVAPVVAVAKPSTFPPEGRESELWWRLYHSAILRGFADPEKVADASVRARERALSLKQARPHTQLATHKPNATETVVASKTKKSRAVLNDAFRCKARTLEGRQCAFKATCGSFCKKHAPPE